jgi:FrmR/RcnR family transcriptional regulator, repressor of frmRAB operon
MDTAYPPGYCVGMHTVRHKSTLIARVRRVKGQIEAVERALTDECSCEEVVRTIAAARGAMDALAAEVLCDHLEDHLAAPRIPKGARTLAAKELARVIRQFVG